MKKLTRSMTDRRVCGVCGGIAEYLGVDSTIVRLVFLGISVIFGSGLFLYILAAIFIPEGGKDSPFGSNEGYSEGYRAGYQKGYEDAMEEIAKGNGRF